MVPHSSRVNSYGSSKPVHSGTTKSQATTCFISIHNYSLIKISIRAYCLFSQQVSTVDKCKMNIITSPGQNLVVHWLGLQPWIQNHFSQSTNFHPSSQRRERSEKAFCFSLRIIHLTNGTGKHFMRNDFNYFGFLVFSLPVQKLLFHSDVCGSEEPVSYCWTFMTDTVRAPVLGFDNTKRSLLHDISTIQ